MAGAVVLLSVITRAFPQSLNLVVPAGAIIVDSEIIDYTDDGSSTVSEYRTSSFSSTGAQTTLSSYFPGDPLGTAAGYVVNPMRAILEPIMQRVIHPLFYKPGRAQYLRVRATSVADRIRNGCTPTNRGATPMRVIGKETVLNYATTVSQGEFGDKRFTEWFAPGLDCFSLRSTTEKALPDGAFRLASEWRVLKVTMNSSATGVKEPNR